MKTADENIGSGTWTSAQAGLMRYGVVQIVVRDSRMVQIEKTERIRFPQGEAA